MPHFPFPHGASAAVSLTYDDALPCHYELVAPRLEAAGFRGTFYAPINATVMEHAEAWREVAARGHELGNHTLFHPCRHDTLTDRSWLPEWRNLVHYSAVRWRQEVQIASFVLSLLDGKAPADHTFGNTCHDNFLGPPGELVCLEPHIAELFVAARGRHTGLAVDPRQPNLCNLGCVSGDLTPFEVLRQRIEQEALAPGKWLVFCMHGVGKGTHGIFTEADVHQQLVDYLGENRQRIWTAPLIEVAKHLRQVKERRESTTESTEKRSGPDC